MEWVPTHSVANDLSWAEERMVVVSANFVPHAGQEPDRIAELGTLHLAWTDDSSLEEEGKEMQREDDAHEQAEDSEDEISLKGGMEESREPEKVHVPYCIYNLSYEHHSYIPKGR